MTPAISMRDVEMVFSGERSGEPYAALRNVQLEVTPGEFFCLLGPSGCGKTSLLNLVAGFVMPTSGTVAINGEAVDRPAKERGVVFQSDRALFDWLTVEENVTFGPRMRGVPEQAWRPVVDEMLKLVGLWDHREKLPRQLSGGMKQRVQIARVLANEPDILLMDEPFAALDAYTRSHLQREVTRIWMAHRRTVLFVTHDITEAIWLADRIGIMTRGPGSRIREIIPVDLPRPRERMTAGFIELFNRLSVAIDAEAGNQRLAEQAA
ncbi:ABC transporter ATP-binding protein [Alsobacter sp. KACC 23698]|uniref:ABC transporter ATP-binding protein n=1 Tax=Alsobacter sp. KACC 23698 TaxID=3149229 RepID=A0AAU7JL81_9HYPH